MSWAVGGWDEYMRSFLGRPGYGSSTTCTVYRSGKWGQYESVRTFVRLCECVFRILWMTLFSRIAFKLQKRSSQSTILTKDRHPQQLLSLRDQWSICRRRSPRTHTRRYILLRRSLNRSAFTQRCAHTHSDCLSTVTRPITRISQLIIAFHYSRAQEQIKPWDSGRP